MDIIFVMIYEIYMDEKPEQIVNYVWINEEKFNDSSGEKLCGVPLHYIDKALHNAKRYPDAQFNIWIDWRYLGDMSKFWLESHLYFQNCSNLKICSLMDIDDYVEEFDFCPDNDHCLWSRVDYARLVVLKSLLKESPWCQVFYSDFDANDVGLADKNIQNQLQRHGIVVAKTECNGVENSFFGFSEKGINYLEKIENMTFFSYSKKDDGYDALKNVLRDENFIQRWADYPEIAAKQMPVSQCNEVKPKKLYTSLSIC